MILRRLTWGDPTRRNQKSRLAKITKIEIEYNAVTPILSMAELLAHVGTNFEMHYCPAPRQIQPLSSASAIRLSQM